MQHIKHYSLCLLVVFALLLGALISAQPALAKDGTMKGNGTQESPYQIEDAKDLIEFARRVNDNDPINEKEGELNAWAELKKDIDLENTSWTPIAYNYEHPYSGTFDGNNHTISGLSINNSSTNYGYFGLFGAVGEGGTVTNLTVEGSITVNSGSNVRAGGVVASNDGDVSNCTSEVTITVEANIAYIGGIIGSNAGNVSNCTNKTDITVTADTAYIGGVIGFNGGSLTNCSNSGAVAGTGQTAYVGGIVGSNNHTESVMGSVENCYNTGTVTATGSNAVAGGVMGVNLNTVNSCYNTGAVTGTTAGGVIGTNYWHGDYYTTPGNVNSCYNTGKVTAPSEGATIGGVVGANSNGSTSGTVNGCYYLEDTAKLAIGDGSGTVENDASKTTEEFASGEVAWLLQDALGENADQAWGQKLSGETPDEYPVLTSDTSKKVYQVTFKDGDSIFATDYANNNDCVTLPENDPPAVTGKTFDGWYNQETDGTEYENSVPVNGSDLVVYAQFTENAPALGAGYDINYTAETATAAENYQISTDGTEFRDGPLTITPGGTLYVRYAGNTEKFTTNTIPARLAAPTLTISNEAEGAEISGAYYYSFTSAEYGNTDWKQGTGALVTVEPDDTIYIYKAATDEAFKSNVQTLTAPSRGAAPTLPTIDYGSETLSGTTAEMEYRVGANGEWKQCTDEDMSVTEWMGQTGYFRTAATNKNYASDPVSLTIPARPVAPSVQGVNESITGSNDGKITGLTAEIAYELSHDNGQTWTDVAAGSTEITDLAPGTYQVRIKAGTDRFASAAASVTIASGATPTYTLTVSAPTFGNVNEGYTQPAAQALTITNSGNSDATISSVTVDSANFTIAGSGDTVPAGESISSWTIQPAAGLSPGTYSATITVTYNNDATATANVQFIVDAAPVDPEDPVDPDDPPYNGKYSYEIASDVGENGIIDVDRYATEGDQVTITVSPDEAYLLDDLTVTSGGKDVALTDNGDGTYTFTMPSGDVAITATFAEDPNWEDPEDPATDVSEIFTDVPANHWAQAAIQYVYDNGLMTGVSDSEFAPEATTTRAMIVSMLARMENVTSAEDAGFADVAADDWYATAVNWAAANGIVNGISDDTFAPNDPITREQLAAMLMNYAQWKGQDTSARADLSGYSDAPSTWASEAVQWAVAEGLLAGVTDDELQPQGQATRAQGAAIMQRFLEA